MVDQTTLHFVKTGGGTGTITGPMFHMGRGVRRKHEIPWLFHFCMGYASGFPLTAIVYFLITRHTTRRMMHWAWKKERPDFEATTGQSWPRCDRKCRQCNPKGTH